MAKLSVRHVLNKINSEKNKLSLLRDIKNKNSSSPISGMIEKRIQETAYNIMQYTNALGNAYIEI